MASGFDGWRFLRVEEADVFLEVHVVVVAGSVILVEGARRVVARTDDSALRRFLVGRSHAMLVDALPFF